MSELQVSLIALGVVLVVGIWFYNKAQERKLRRAAEKVFQGNQPDALLAGAEDEPATAHEPTLAPLPEPAQPPVSETYERIEPQIPDEAVEELTEPTPAAAEYASVPVDEPADFNEPTLEATPAYEPGFVAQAPHTQAPARPAPHVTHERGAEPPLAWCDPIADYVANFELTEPQHPVSISAAFPASSKPTRCIARTSSGEWVLPELYEQKSYSSYRACLQMVDRRGAISEEELTAFHDSMSALATKLSARLEISSPGEMLVQARAIDDFCAQLDLQLAINIVDPGDSAFAGTKLRGLAEAAGLQLNTDGAFICRDDSGQLLFTLADLSGQLFDTSSLRTLVSHGVSFVLDVPRVPNGAHVFDRMLIIARQMANALGGQLANAQRAPLGDAMISGIRARIVEIQQQMADNQIPAGGDRALRLFF